MFRRNIGKQSRRVEGTKIVIATHLFSQFEPGLLVHGIDSVKAVHRKTVEQPLTLRPAVILLPPCGPYL